MRVLVTGASSGLGKALRRAFDAEALSRSALDNELRRLAASGVDLVVHCAADARKEFPAGELPAYRDSNLTLTERLLGVPHRLFVYVSSQAVYPEDDRAWREDDRLEVSPALSIYGVFKLLAEGAVRTGARRALILRCASLVGPEGRSNNIMRVLRREGGRLFLAGASRYNLIAYSQVGQFIRESFEQDRVGTFNIGAASEATLAEIAAHLCADVEFGDHVYRAPLADLSKVQRATDIFTLTTLEVAGLVARQIGESASGRSATA